ncbi:hypothetical protein PsYK624_133190 [Phanerochaete sordida]|uniref:Uncharacterized protein n=1 Tax=Phanerochaete sordida TaxID=48140 RepID=A0A9P3LJA9_9APHY|nr:hypothetical protein PsYK624_133190 [Phanerochaete sordida]
MSGHSIRGSQSQGDRQYTRVPILPFTTPERTSKFWDTTTFIPATSGILGWVGDNATFVSIDGVVPVPFLTSSSREGRYGFLVERVLGRVLGDDDRAYNSTNLRLLSPDCRITSDNVTTTFRDSHSSFPATLREIACKYHVHPTKWKLLLTIEISSMKK